MKLELYLVWAAATYVAAQRRGDAPKVVDLGYAMHAPLVNVTGSYYSFTNIPYAQQPIGALRFMKPVPISGTNTEVQNSSASANQCMQAYPSWIFNEYMAVLGADYNTTKNTLLSLPGQTESCLMVDVHVPAGIFDNGSKSQAPVLVWIHGGGYVYGSKTIDGGPAGLLARSQLNGTSGVIIVSINYRLGLYGWLAGGKSTPNLGLYDQRLALQWVKKYISKFGGNPDHVTVAGQSAGASSILHHITGFGGIVSAPFEAAIPISPAYQYNLDYEKSYSLTLKEAASASSKTVSSVSELDRLDSTTLRTINQIVVEKSDPGSFNFGPIVDGYYVPKRPQVLLYEGNFDQSIKIMPSHTSNETGNFVPHTISNATDVQNYMPIVASQIRSEIVDHMLTTVYPDVLNGTYPWRTEFERAAQITSDHDFVCNTRFLNAAFGSQSYKFVFAIPSGFHGEDVPFYFFNGPSPAVSSPEAAETVQDYILAFVKTWNPNVKNRPAFPAYGSTGQVLRITTEGPKTETDETNNSRCDWFQRALLSSLI